jgi:hypothetical protein
MQMCCISHSVSLSLLNLNDGLAGSLPPMQVRENKSSIVFIMEDEAILYSLALKCLPAQCIFPAFYLFYSEQCIFLSFSCVACVQAKRKATSRATGIEDDAGRRPAG